MVLLSVQGMDVAAIAKVAFTSEDRLRDVIRNFNWRNNHAYDERLRQLITRAHAWHDRPASRRMGWPADPPSGALAGHCHDRNRSFDLSPCLAALVRT